MTPLIAGLPIKAAKSGPLSGGPSYHAAAADVMAVEFAGEGDRAALLASAKRHLERAFAQGYYGQLDPSDVARDRAFRSVKGEAWFVALLEKRRKGRLGPP